MKENDYPSLETSHILTESEMEDTLEGYCNSNCKSCTPGNKNSNIGNGNDTDIDIGIGGKVSDALDSVN